MSLAEAAWLAKLTAAPNSWEGEPPEATCPAAVEAAGAWTATSAAKAAAVIVNAGMTIKRVDSLRMGISTSSKSENIFGAKKVARIDCIHVCRDPRIPHSPIAEVNETSNRTRTK